MMKSMNVGAELIMATPWFSTPQPTSEGSFMQTFQDAVTGIADGTAPPAAGTQQSSETQTPQQGSAQSVQPRQQDDQVKVQENQSAQPEENVWTATDTQSAQQSEHTAQDVQEAPVTAPEAAEADDKLLKELADLLSSKEDMLSAVEDMKQKLEDLILQAFEDLNDPEKQQKEYEEKILEFLLKYIEKVFGKEDDEETHRPLESSDEEDADFSDVMDILLQAVVQTLEDIRSEDADVPEESEEDIPEAGYIPPSKSMTAPEEGGIAEKLPEETELNIGKRHMLRRPGRIVPEARELLRERRISAADPTVPKPGPTPVRDEVMAAGDEAQLRVNGMTELTQSAQPADTENLYYQTAENIFVQLTQTEKPEVQPAKTETGKQTNEVAALAPADELEELARLVRTGDSARPEQLDFTDHGEKAEQPELEVKLAQTGEAVPFEAAIATARTEQVLTQPAGLGAGSGAQQIVTQIVSEIFNQLPESGGNTTFVMTLNPESLGRVTVKLVEEAGKLSLTVTAHSRQTAELLASRLDNLQASMKENGTQLEKYQVVYAPEKDERPGQQNYEGSSRNPYFRQDEEEGEGGDEFAELLQQAV